MVLLRGYLNVSLTEADELPDCDTAFFNIDPKDTSDPFAQIKIGSCVICKTAYINNNLSPRWRESFQIPVCHETDSLQVQVLDKDHISAGLLGEVEVRAEDLLEGDGMDGWYPLSGCEGKINFTLNYVPKEMIEATFEVPNCYFNPRENCKVTLYHDAHCPSLPIFDNVSEVIGEEYNPTCAWTDLYKALNGAENFIYITGWSVFTETVLVRGGCEDSEGVGETLGQLLIRKAEAGVRVLILIWNEKLSNEVMPGLMGTHDEETRIFFEGTNVEVAVVPRMKKLDGVGSFLRNQFSQTCYTHHQKSVIVDSPPLDGEELPRVIAFLGGLDLTNGRYDTPSHDLFKTLQNDHQGDFYNGCVDTTEEFGPRQPWHDIHCKLEGPVVIDIISNFTERWRNQAADMETRLLPITEDKFAINEPAPVDDPELSWTTQLFRSISSDSAHFNFNRISTIPKRKGKYVDDSIHRAYIHQIRRCDSFIFIENQYFLGSAYGWDDEQTTKAHHLIPQEICQRIKEKINAGEHLSCYVVVPMYPEGVPSSGPVQEILHWQHRTMEMMYKNIAAAIAENELDTHPTDYLSFFCLGKGECTDEIPEDLPAPDPETPASRLREQARFMIYVHSKMMIIDDDYIIVGSANINQRSMGGTRDSEIAIGAYQSAHTRESTDGAPRGGVHKFRMALFAEHLGSVSETHNDPGTIECMQAVKEAAANNWEQFVADEPCQLDGHLLKYPVNVEADGTVTPIEGQENFPDTDAPVIGAPNYLPNKLTT